MATSNKGLIRNAGGSSQLRYYSREASFTAIVGAFCTSAERSIGALNYDKTWNIISIGP